MAPPTAMAAPAVPAGWYNDPTYGGHQRYWDGMQWLGQPAPMAQYPVVMANPSDERTMAVIAHIGQIFGGFVVPLIIFLIKKDESPYVRHHAAEALNFSITTAIASFVCILLMFVLIGFLLLPVLIIGHLVFLVIATMAANRGEWYRYPINLRLVK